VTWPAGTQRAAPEPPAASGDLNGGEPGRRPAPVTHGTTGPSADRLEALRAYWLSPPGVVMLAATGLALAVRLYLLSRAGYLTGITEYDDGVYLGGALSLLSGTPAYHGFAFVQPPGILLLMAPVALLAKVSAVTSAMAAARLLTVAASAACVTLLGSLVRHRGGYVTLVACGLLAVYPDDIMAAHTLLLEPWMNLLVLGGACLAFRGGQLAAPRRLLWAGAAFGLAGAVKYWAMLPALGLLAACLLTGPQDGPGQSGGRAGQRRDRAVRFAGGVLAGFAIPVAPFAVPWPGLFARSTLLDQVSRAGSAVPESLRLAHLTGLAGLLNDAGRLTLPGNAGSLFARGDVTAAATWATGSLPVLLAVAVAALIGLGYLAGGTRAGPACQGSAARKLATSGAPGPLEWYALGTLGGTLAAVLGYSAFFYHYADFAAPWLAIAAGYAAGALRRPAAGLRRPARRRQQVKREKGCGVGTGPPPPALVVVAGAEAWELSGLHASDVTADAALIPPGACVVSDEISLAIAANRFTAASAGCPDVLDSLATTLVASNGVSIQGGAKALPQVAAEWRSIFSRAQYAWLSGSSDRRIPWTAGLKKWFAANFRPLHPPRGELSEGQVYVRRS
jgi:hypothetical protein